MAPPLAKSRARHTPHFPRIMATGGGFRDVLSPVAGGSILCFLSYACSIITLIQKSYSMLLKCQFDLC